MELGIIETALDAVRKAGTLIGRAFTFKNNTSLASVTKLTRVEPLTILSKDCLNLEYLPDVNSALLNFFAAYYIQSIDILTKVNDIDVVRVLDRLNPAGHSGYDPKNYTIGTEHHKTNILANYQHSLPMPGVATPGLEADDSTKNLLQEVSNLAVGKLINVDIAYTVDKTGETKTLKLPINMRLLTMVAPSHSIVSILTSSTDDNSLVERFHSVLSGRISFIKDFIFCQDLIDEHRKAVIADESGSLDEIYRRAANAKTRGIWSNNPSLAICSTLVVMSKEQAQEVEAKLGGKLSNKRFRAKAFENTYSMIIVVIDKEWERVTFHVRDQETSIDLSIKEIKGLAKGKGPDIMDVMKAFQSGLPAF